MKLILLLRALIAGAVVLQLTALTSVLVILTGHRSLRGVQDVIVKSWGVLALWAVGVRLKTQGLDGVPSARGVLFLFNHQSLLDIAILSAIVPKSFRFGAKIELFKIPVFSMAMRAAGMLPISRQNRTDVFKVYKNAEIRVAAGESFALAPEGTRQDKPEIGAFKRGPFLFAVNCRSPIVPVVIKGIYDVLPKHELLPARRRWFTDVKVVFGTTHETAEIQVDQIEQLKERVRSEFVTIYAGL